MTTSIRNIFDLETPYQEDKEAFYQYMENNAQELFSDVGNTRFKVPYLMVKSVINEGRRDNKGAKHRALWSTFNGMAKTTQVNSNFTNLHKAEIFKMLIDESQGSYPRLMNLIEETIETWQNEGYQFNVLKYMYQNNLEKRGLFQ